jgi:hypothetical protein
MKEILEMQIYCYSRIFKILNCKQKVLFYMAYGSWICVVTVLGLLTSKRGLDFFIFFILKDENLKKNIIDFILQNSIL